MATQFLTPGVYIQEIPSGAHTIAGVATSITAFIGYLRRGPASLLAADPATPVQLQNYGDFQRVFGGLDGQSETSYQVNQFFLNGGSTAWVTRVFATDPKQQPILPTVTVSGSDKPAGGASSGPPKGSRTLQIDAANPGSWGGNVYVTVDSLTTVRGGFNLYATEYNFAGSSPSVVKTIPLAGVVMDRAKPNYVCRVLANGDPNAALIAITDCSQDGTVGPTPFVSGTVLSVPIITKVAENLTFTFSVQPPPPPAAPGGSPATPAAPYKFSVKSSASVSDVADLIAALQGAFAAAVTTLPLLSSARISLVPLQPAVPAPSPSKPPPRLIQIVLTDPRRAGYVVDITCSAASLFTVLQTNVQAYRLADATVASAPDGIPPTGADLVGSQANRDGIYALEEVDLFNILALPDLRNMDDGNYLIAATAALNYCVDRRAVAILDIQQKTQDVHVAQTWVTQTVPTFGTGITNAAAYFPELVVPDPLNAGQPRPIGASGTMAGIYAATDRARGVWKAPAGIEAALAGVQGLVAKLSDSDNGLINPYGLNALRIFSGRGAIAWGARTLAAGNEADQDWKYIPVRRLALDIEESLYRGLQWAVFEPNDDRLWAQLRISVGAFMHDLFVSGAFAGKTPATAYQVICNESTTTPDDMAMGLVNILVRFAPLEPAEFVSVTIQQMVGQSSS